MAPFAHALLDFCAQQSIDDRAKQRQETRSSE
jgi:hypothetical protein